jgi:hypothetical protein
MFSTMPPNVIFTSQASPSIASLAEQVSKLSASINLYLNTNGHQQPNFSLDSAELPETREYEALRNRS